MGKRLVSAKSIDEFICKSTNKFYMDGSFILTPGAKDALSEKGIKIEYCPKRECNDSSCINENPEQVSDESLEEFAVTDETEDLLFAVASVLKNEYGISDHRELVESSRRIANIFKKNF